MNSLKELMEEIMKKNKCPFFGRHPKFEKIGELNKALVEDGATIEECFTCGQRKACEKKSS